MSRDAGMTRDARRDRVRRGAMDRDELAFTYFPDNYRWSHGLLLALGAAPWGGGEIGEINRVGLRLAATRSGDDRAWFDEWTRVAERVETVGRERAASGKAMRFRNLPLHHETERYASAAYEYLATRPEVDAARVGVMAISLGGYYAPRAAAFESRFAACIAWGAQWDYHAVWKERLDRIARGETPSLSVPWEHLLWIFGVTTRDEALKRLEGFRLDGVVQRIRCPFLLVHGEGDAQIPLATAQKCFGAVGSTRKTFKVFTREEGGYHHCQSDNVSIGTAYMWDWLAEVFAM